MRIWKEAGDNCYRLEEEKNRWLTISEDCVCEQSSLENTAMQSRDQFMIFPIAASGRAFWMVMVMIRIFKRIIVWGGNMVTEDTVSNSTIQNWILNQYWWILLTTLKCEHSLFEILSSHAFPQSLDVTFTPVLQVTIPAKTWTSCGYQHCSDIGEIYYQCLQNPWFSTQKASGNRIWAKYQIFDGQKFIWESLAPQNQTLTKTVE